MTSQSYIGSQSIALVLFAATILISCERQEDPAAQVSQSDAIENQSQRQIIERPAPDVSQLHWEALQGNVSEVRQLIGNGADIQAKTKDGTTVLQSAAISGNAELVNMLIEMGADVDAVALGGTTPLYSAALNGKIDVVEALIAHGANVNGGGAPITPLKAAIIKNHKGVERLLRQYGASETYTSPVKPIAPSTQSQDTGTLSAKAFVCLTSDALDTLDREQSDPHNRAMVQLLSSKTCFTTDGPMTYKVLERIDGVPGRVKLLLENEEVVWTYPKQLINP